MQSLTPVSQEIVKLRDVTYAVSEQDDIFAYNAIENKIKRVATFIFCIIIFPIGIPYLFVKALNHVCIKNFLLPSLILDKTALDRRREALFANPLYAQRFERQTIQTTDGVKLDALMIHYPEEVLKPIQNRKYILFFNGNGGTYESTAPVLLNISNETGASVLTFNYRGVGRSEGFPACKKDIKRDGEAMVQSLLSLGVHPSNILIHGWSFGGAAGAEVAALHQEQGYEINYCGDRTFSSLVDDIHALFNRKYLNLKKTHLILALAIKILTPLVVGFTYITGWNFKTLEAYRTITGHKFIIYHLHDKVIPYKVSLFKKLKKIQMTMEDKLQKQDRKRDKILARVRRQPYVKLDVVRSYRPPHVISLDRTIDPSFAHSIDLELTPQFNDYKTQVALALK